MAHQAYGQLQSPISPGVSSPDGGSPEGLPHHAHHQHLQHSADPAWPESAREARHADETIAIRRMSFGENKQQINAPAASTLATRRKSQEGINTQKPVPAAAEGGKARASWEPVSPGLADQSPEVVASQRPKEYYAWPANNDEQDAKASASSSSSGAGAMGAGGRRGSKAAELAFPLHGLEGGMTALTGAEFCGLLRSALKSRDLATTRRLLTAPLPPNVGTIKCFIKRHKSGLVNTFYPSYEFFLEEPSAPLFLMSSKKRSKNSTSNYTISLLTVAVLEKSSNAASLTSEDPSYLGKLRSNFSGSEYVGFDAGINPKTLLANSGQNSSLSRRPSESKLVNVRQELCCISFKSNIMSRCPRQFTCVLPGMLPEDPCKRIICRPLVPSDSLLYQYKALTETEAERNPQLHAEQIAYKEILILGNKEPVFEASIGAFCLNFHGRATHASVKNFQLINRAAAAPTVLLQFGKMDKDVFTVDATYPLSLVQAFEISLAGLDSKIICD